MNGIHTLKYPSGRWGFCGRVPVELSFRCSPEDAEVVALCGPGLARKGAEIAGREFEVVSYETEDDALAALAAWRERNPQPLPPINLDRLSRADMLMLLRDGPQQVRPPSLHALKKAELRKAMTHAIKREDVQNTVRTFLENKRG